jgi:hypothetical protein
MRFLTVQQMVASLVQYLQLPTSPFPMGGTNNLASLRGHVLTDADFSDPSKIPYWLTSSEQGKNPGQLLVNAINTVVPNASNLTPQQWEGVKKDFMWNGDNLYNWGLWNVLMSINSATNQPVLSSEAYALLYEGGGYESLVDNWNCAEAFEYLLIDFPSNAQYLRLSQGYQTLPQTLAQQFTSNGGTINMNCTLTNFAYNTVNGAPVIDFDVINRISTGTTYYRANALILAMPRRSLEIVFEGSGLLPQFRGLLDLVMPMPAYKTLLGYPTPWWQNSLGLTSGRSTTDLPLRQVYYFGSETGVNTNSLLLATYADGRCESFWKPLWGSPGKPNPLPLPGPADVLMTMQQLLAQMHGIPVSQIPEPYFVAYKDWTEDPYGAGWHFWKPGFHAGEAMPAVRQPNQQYPLYICGEAYGNEQGWAEGALTSAEHVMQDLFGLAWPAWLPTNYYLGP